MREFCIVSRIFGTAERRKTVKIMLDPGHAGRFYNASPVVDGYYESSMTWALAQKLSCALTRRGFEVALTREAIDDDPELVERGRRAAGYDLLLSLHSNAASEEKLDAPWMIHFSPDRDCTLVEQSERAAHALGGAVSGVLGTSEAFYYTKRCDFDRNGDGKLNDEWYGVLYGAKSVGVPAVIVEHGFHTNARTARLLLRDDVLESLAEAEAAALAELYGIKGDDSMTKNTDELRELERRVEALEEQVKIKWAYVDENLPSWARETVTKLVKSGALRGNGENSLELSRLLLRILVILDRAGAL